MQETACVFIYCVRHACWVKLPALLLWGCSQSWILGSNNDRKEARPQNQRHRQGFTGATARAERRHTTYRMVRRAFWNRADSLFIERKFLLRIPLPANKLIREREKKKPPF